MIYGFTGTKHGMSTEQKECFREIVKGRHVVFHHGDCIGADAEAHDIVVSNAASADIIIHPPLIAKYRAFKYGICRVGSTTIRKPREYLARNHDIVNESQAMIATPRFTYEELRSGTWATIRYAKKVDKKLTIIYPDGTTEDFPQYPNILFGG